MATTVSNGTVDTAAAAVPGPYGPLTRVSDVSTFPTPNSEQQIAFTSDIGDTPVSMTYDQLTNADLRLEILERAHGWTAVVTQLIAAITDLNTAAGSVGDSGDPPYSYADYQTLLDNLRTNFAWIRGIIG